MSLVINQVESTKKIVLVIFLYNFCETYKSAYMDIILLP